MKKPKQPFEPEEDEIDSPQIIGIGLDDDLEDDDIIDLDDIVDLEDELLDDEDQADLEVELLDAEPDLGDIDSPLDEGSDDVLDNDILKELAFSEGESSTEDSEEELDFGDESQNDNLDELLRFNADVVGDDDKRLEAKDLIFDEPEISAVSESASAASEAVLDAAVSRMEERLAQTIREIIDARLPGIVRSILQEEIQRLKDEMK